MPTQDRSEQPSLPSLTLDDLLAPNTTMDFGDALDGALSPSATFGARVRESTRAPRTAGVPERQSFRTTVQELPAMRVANVDGAPHAPDEAPDVLIIGVLGVGGMGRVELGRQRALDREVAVKRVRPDRLNPATVDALYTEAHVTGALEHPNIVPVHLLGRDVDGAPIMVMKRVEGVSWGDLLKDPDHPMWRGVPDRLLFHLDVLTQVCDAVHFAHSRRVLHRDLKTENIMVGSFGEVYVVDWGIAVRLDAPPSRAICGTPAFMAPEMLDGTERLSVRSDVFLLGGVLHEVLAGRPRHAGETVRETLEAVRRCDPPSLPAAAPAALADLCRRATASDPALRPADVAAFKREIESYVRNRGSIALAADAEQRRAELATLLAALHAGVPAEARLRARRLCAEASFGFRQALAAWAENPAGAVGLRACLLLSVDLELLDRNAVGARAALSEVTDAPSELALRVSELEAALAAEARASSELAQIRHDASASVGLVPRTAAMVGIHASIAAFWLGLARIGVAITHEGILAFGLVLLVSLLATFRYFRHTLMANRFNRQVLYALVAFCVYNTVEGALGYISDVRVDHLAWSAYLAISLMFAVMAMTMAPVTAVLIPPAVISAVYCALVPSAVAESLSLFNASAALAWLVAFWVERGARRDA